MSDHELIRDLFDQYTSRSSERGVGWHIEHLGDGDVRSYASSESTDASRRRGRALAAAGAAFVLAVCVAAFAVSARGPATVVPATPAAAPSESGSVPHEDGSDRVFSSEQEYRDSLSPEKQREFDAAIAERNALESSGWRRWSVAPVFDPPGTAPAFAYEPTLPEVLATVPAGGRFPRTPLFDQPGGTLIGYDYPNAGFVSVAMADAPGFDAKTAYIKRGVCAPVETEQECEGRPR